MNTYSCGQKACDHLHFPRGWPILILRARLKFNCASMTVFPGKPGRKGGRHARWRSDRPVGRRAHDRTGCRILRWLRPPRIRQRWLGVRPWFRPWMGPRTRPWLWTRLLPGGVGRHPGGRKELAGTRSVGASLTAGLHLQTSRPAAHERQRIRLQLTRGPVASSSPAPFFDSHATPFSSGAPLRRRSR